ncbi:uncharacterized protein LOC143316313 [Chaetodon auriga]|uniref:uncharacterized protein LOC143316313 n=1 Tax=Chaetodon auriga TaxID=39042 RepID=UPI004032FBE4
MDFPISFKQQHVSDRQIYGRRASAGPGPEPGPEPESGPGPEASCLSLKSERSMGHLIDFKGDRPSAAKRVHQESSEVPSGQSAQQHQTHLDSIFMLLEENIVSFVRNELKKIKTVLSPDDPECLKSQGEDEEVLDGEDAEQRRSSREAFLKITQHFLRRMKEEELAERLQSSKRISRKV